MIATVLDTGPLAAAFNTADRRHPECASLMTSLTGRRLLPSPVMTEVCWLLERWPQVEAAFLAEVARGTFEKIPAVISGPRSATETLPSVDSDNYGGARSAVEHLLARGCRTIAHITGRLDVYGAQRRVEGYRDALLDVGHSVDDTLVEQGDFTEEGGRRAMTRLLQRSPGLDAVFAGSDVMAAGARQVLREEGRRIPDDVALVGYDDSAIARHMDPPLTSVRQPIQEMGRAMIELLLGEIADRRRAASRGPERQQLVLPTELEPRASS